MMKCVKSTRTVELDPEGDFMDSVSGYGGGRASYFDTSSTLRSQMTSFGDSDKFEDNKELIDAIRASK